jgi:hypothetical protein
MRALLVGGFIVIYAVIASATILNVPANYPTIQAGVNAAGPGDTVKVAPGFYRENVHLTEGVRLIGSGMLNTTIDGGGLGDVVSALQVSNVVIEGFNVQNSQQSGSAPGCIGIFLNPQTSSGTKIVRNCHVHNCGHGIQIWNDFGGTAIIEHNLINNNLFDGFFPYLGTVYLTNNTIVSNGRDGYNDWSGGGNVTVKNNIIANNGRYGIFKHQNTPVFISYNDVWNNAQGAYYQGYSGPATPFTPSPGTGEIAANPLFAGPPYGFYITWVNFPIPDQTKSRCIDAADPASPFDPDQTRADIGASYFDQRDLSVACTALPVNPPVVIPQGGGTFSYLATITNHETFAVTCDAWTMVTLPGGQLFGPLAGPTTLTIPAGTTVSRTKSQAVPGSAVGGTYNFHLYVGHYPTTIWGGESFPVTKTGDGVDLAESNTWPVGEEVAFDLTSPIGFEEYTFPNSFTVWVAPNPFNASTVLSYKLQVAGHVSLKVYDTTGRLVATLAEGWREAGESQVTFNGSGLATGVYLYRLQAGEQIASGTIALLK